MRAKQVLQNRKAGLSLKVASAFLAFCIILALSILIGQNFTQNSLQNFANFSSNSQNFENFCLDCHQNYEAPSISHTKLTCIDCHNGVNSKDKNLAHSNLLPNPASLVNSKEKCLNCHQNQTARVSSTPMQTQRPIRENLIEDWVIKAHSDDLSKAELEILAKDHFQKACNACHIDQKPEIFTKKNIAKGGGCIACHGIKGQNHIKFSTQIPSQNCTACHNRSARIGLSYFGKFESEGVKAPFDTNHTLPDGRHFNELKADIHHEKMELDCIDCHTSYGVMGDLKAHKNMREAVDIDCKDCHAPNFKAPNETAKKLKSLNLHVPTSQNIAYTRKKDTPLYNVAKKGEKAILYRKKDGKAYEISLLSASPYHQNDFHQNLSCQACHSQWMPSCYGCHEQYFADSTQYNWQTKKLEKGEWREMRSFLRFESPALGVRNDGKIATFAPGCQVIATIFDKNVSKFHSMSMASWDPHTTGASKTCVECHFSSTALGFGRGNLKYEKNELKFSPYFEANATKFGFSYSIDAFLDTNGTQNQHASKGDKALNKAQIHKITEAYKCVICHDSWDDKIYQDFEQSKKSFSQGKTKCLD